VGHFGPKLRRFVLAQYHHGQITVERLTTLLRDLGVDISKRQVVRLLTAGQDGFLDENRAVLRAGLETAAWITVDDTGARHRDRNGTCTRIGNHCFAWFATTFSKSRLNFLELLRAGFEDYVINPAALDYMRARQLPGPAMARLASHERRRFATEAAWTAHLEDLAITPRPAHPDPLRVATEGALWGSIVERGWLTDTVILSDDAGQFNVGRHALCWVHAERLVHKLDTFCQRQRRAKARIQTRIWWLYAISRPIAATPRRGAGGRSAPASTACSRPEPALPPWTGFWRGCMPTVTNSSWCWTIPTCRSTPTTPRTTSVARSRGARSPAEPGPRPDVNAATPSSA
jgi:hypothetical protein